MKNELEINHTYSCTYSDTVKLPKGKSAENIVSQYIKWGTIFITFDDGSELESDLAMSGESEGVDTKRPGCVDIYRRINGETDYSKDYAD